MSRPAARIAQRKVLLVDDDVISLELLALLLGHEGHQVLQAADGDSALRLLTGIDRSGFPDVLLVDMQMPGVSGNELALRVRALKGSKPLLLAMSATEIQQHQLQAFDGFLLKPLALEELRKALKPTKRAKSFSAAAPRRRAAAATGRDSVDWAIVGKLRRAMRPQSLIEVYEACLSDTRRRIALLQELTRTAKFADISREAHQIKGAASMVGASRIAGLAAVLELGSYKEEDTPRLLDELLNACDELKRMLLAGTLQKSNDNNDS